MCAYTYGLQAFGKREMEVLDSAASPQQLHDFLYALASYVLDQDVTLNDGETIGFSAEEKLPDHLRTGPVAGSDDAANQLSAGIKKNKKTLILNRPAEAEAESADQRFNFWSIVEKGQSLQRKSKHSRNENTAGSKS